VRFARSCSSRNPEIGVLAQPGPKPSFGLNGVPQCGFPRTAIRAYRSTFDDSIAASWRGPWISEDDGAH
jgi:hypothetical protein